MAGKSNLSAAGKKSPDSGTTLLCLETSTGVSSVALVNRAGLLARCCRNSPAPHTADLFPTVKRLLDDCGERPSDLFGVGVAAGPGSFTGLRVALSAAKTLAWAAGVPLFAVGSLEALAFGAADRKLPVCALFNAGQNELYAAAYSRPTPGSPAQELIAPGAFTLEKLCSELRGFDRLICLGEGFRTREQELTACLGQRLEKTPARCNLPDAALVGELVLTAPERYRVKDIFGFEPFYVRCSRTQLRLKI